MAASTTMFNDPSLQVVSITDFSPGVFSYGTQAFPASYTTRPPLGSAAQAFRCINRPGIGLVPFYGHSLAISWVTATGNSPAASPWKAFLNAGMGALTGVIPNTLTLTLGNANIPATQLYTATDYLVATWIGVDNAGNLYSQGARWMSNDGFTPFNTATNLWSNAPMAFCTMTCFDVTTQNQTSGPYNLLVFNNGGPIIAPAATTNAFFAPGQVAATAELYGIAPFGSSTSWCCFSHGNRVLTGVDVSQPNGGPLASNLVSTDTFFFYSDPPAARAGSSNPTFAGSINYTLDSGWGMGAWGSVSTGELVLIRRGGGAVVITGDPAFPSFVAKLPAVQGVGLECQRMAMCNAGAVYVTESNGVWAWNGGNVAAKISEQIPDNACIRTSLLPGGFPPGGFGATGVRQHSDVMNNLVFLANNWVFDSINNSWWQCEDPSVLNFVTWTRSATTFMYGMTDQVATPGASFPIHGFDNRTLATSWQWTSNPIPPPTPGGLPTLEEVEIVASNPFGAAATVTITPTAPPAGTPTHSNNPQPYAFTIPAHAQSFRASRRFGFTESNVCVQVAANGGSNPAPALHELHLGFGEVSTSGV